MWYFIGLVDFHHFSLTDVMQNVLSGRLDPSVPIMIRSVFLLTHRLFEQEEAVGIALLWMLLLKTVPPPHHQAVKRSLYCFTIQDGKSFCG